MRKRVYKYVVIDNQHAANLRQCTANNQFTAIGCRKYVAANICKYIVSNVLLQVHAKTLTAI